jgi:CheY-like chemotaxis protein/two-component sensor histidine kinase
VRNLILMQESRDQIDRLREEGEAASRAKDEFLAMLGHELRNPLSPILTALQLMKLQGPEHWDRARTIIERQVSHLTRLVDDLLDVSRIARGKVELKTEPVEMADLVVRAIEMASPLIEQRRHVLSVDVPRRGLRVEADPTRLAQVISNLLTNAAKYTAPGGRIRVSAHRTTGEVVLRVRDSGVGITRDVLPHVFDLFVQGRQSIDRSQGGLGLGLTIVRSLVEGHGGSVQARSGGPGCGSEFIVRLPRIPRGHGVGSDDDLASPFVDDRHAHGPRVLVVDDNEDAAEMLVDALAQRGYEARGTYDALSALQLAEEFQPEIAVLDIGLPVMDGYELGARLRTLSDLADLRLIAVTGYGQPSDRQRTREAGFDHHLVKPIEMNALESALNAPASTRVFRR